MCIINFYSHAVLVLWAIMEKRRKTNFTFVFKGRTFVFSELEGSKRQKQKQKIARVIFQEDALIEHFAIAHV